MKLESSLLQLTESQTKIVQVLEQVIPSNKNNTNGEEEGGGTSSAPTSPIVSQPAIKKTAPNQTKKQETLPEIEPLVSHKDEIKFTEKIVTADLEAIIHPETGQNLVYMAAWYNGSLNHVFSINQYENNKEAMLKAFWEDLIYWNKGRVCYFHNWGGYDALLSLPSLLNLPRDLSFLPLMKNREMLALEIKKGTTTILTIKDSIKILPGALGKLAKDWKVETQKEHFPHYFFLDNIENTLNYQGVLPAYTYFEKKRTSLKEYEEMQEIFKTKAWNYLEVSKEYIKGDCIALFEILIAFFNTLKSKFPINPLQVLSAPSTSFKIWRTIQLPILHRYNQKVYDLSRNYDEKFR